MRIATFHDHGGPEALVLGEAPEPRPGPTDVLIRILAAGVNRADVLQREGRYPPPSGAPKWPGLEVAGEIAAVGEGVERWAVGDAVCALLPGGGYAELAAVDAGLVLPVPAGLTMAEAGGLMEAACTVQSNLQAADARAGERLLVHGGSGGVGHLAIQIGIALGLDVWATAGGPERAARCAELGAQTIDYRDDEFETTMAAAGGADVILDVVGAAYLSRNIEALASGGRLVVIGMQRGARAELNLGQLLTKRAHVIGTTLRSRPLAQRRAIVAAVEEQIWPLVPQAVRPIIHATVPLSRAADAHRALESGTVFGKLVLTTGD
ncbi:NAD(P)H-quinone oxidoreductase [Demequina sp. SO4-13]|uniref:NAD(P)H-quinone oxidoreductase n=1 Tax=Demequina sp. SO4-13 TaxID=3401027 RepID=UPI003AF88212